MTTITLDTANTLIAAIFAEGQAKGLKPLSAVVTDAGGHVIAFQRQDGASSGRFRIALGKASGALFLGISSRKVQEMAAERPTFLGSLTPIAPDGIVPAAGGLLIYDAEGTLLGAVGVTGDTSDNDEAAAAVGISAVGLQKGI
ncbi:MAG: heme-binding protein [Novosphingobium sp.]